MILDYLLQQLIALQGYIIFCVVSGIVLLFIWLLLCTRAGFKNRRMDVLGLLFGMSTRDRMCICALWLRLIFVVWCVVFKVALQPIHYIVLGMLFLWTAILLLDILYMLGSVVAALITGVALTVCGLLTEYNQQIKFEVIVETVYWLLGIFVVLYAIYLFIGELSKISSKRGVKNIEIGE